MTTFTKYDRHPDVPADVRSSDELVKRIRKLRWIGMEEEAESLEQTFQHVRRTGQVLTGRLDTD